MVTLGNHAHMARTSKQQAQLDLKRAEREKHALTLELQRKNGLTSAEALLDRQAQLERRQSAQLEKIAEMQAALTKQLTAPKVRRKPPQPPSPKNRSIEHSETQKRVMAAQAAVKRARLAFEKQGQGGAAMTMFASAFDSLADIPGIDPWDPSELCVWAQENIENELACTTIGFLVSIWIGRSGSFDLHAALQLWDEPHAKAFQAWVTKPWWPNA